MRFWLWLGLAFGLALVAAAIVSVPVGLLCLAALCLANRALA